MSPLAHVELVRIHQAELRQAADQHRLVAAARRATRRHRRGRAHLLDRLVRRASRTIPEVSEAEPCPQ